MPRSRPFATSSPELSVSINAALAGKPQIALGDALGSNVVNVALILGAALAISGIQSPRAGLKRDFPAALLVPIVTGLLCLDGSISRGLNRDAIDMPNSGGVVRGVQRAASIR